MLQGKPQIWVSRIGHAMPFFPCGASFWRSHWLAVVLRWSGVSPPTSSTMGVGGMAPQRLDGGCMLCCVHMEEEPSGAVLASMFKSGERPISV
jgi:hypothetical protein